MSNRGRLLLIAATLVVAGAVGLFALSAEQDAARHRAAPDAPKRIAVVTGWDFLVSSTTRLVANEADRSSELFKDSSIEIAMNQLEQRLVSRLSETGRFSVIEQAEVRRALRDGQSGSASSPDDDQGFVSQLVRAIQQLFIRADRLDGDLRVANEPRDGASNGLASDETSPENSRVRTVSRSVSAYGQREFTNIRNLADELAADYVLFGDMERLVSSEREISNPYSERSSKIKITTHKFWFRFRLTDLTRMEISSARTYVAELDQITRPGESTAPYTALPEIYDEVSRQIVATVLDHESPAIVSSINPLSISRGSNDGVTVGDRYRVSRIVNTLRDSANVEIQDLRTIIGRVRVTETNERASLVEPVSGGPFQVNDRVEFTPTAIDHTDEASRTDSFGRPRSRPADEVPIGPGRGSLPRERRPDQEWYDDAGFRTQTDDNPLAVFATALDTTKPKPRLAVLPLKFGSTSPGRGDPTSQNVVLSDDARGYLKSRLKLSDRFLNSRDGGGLSVNIFTDSMITGFTSTGRFRVMERQEVDEIISEQNMQRLQNGDLSALGNSELEAIDYLVVGNLSYITLETMDRRLPQADRDLPSKVFVRMSGNVRFVNVASGEISVSTSVNVLKPLGSVDRDAVGEVFAQRLVADTANEFSRKSVALILNGAYPIVVAGISSDGRIYLNRGRDGGLFTREVLNVFRPEQAIEADIDMPDIETRVGTIRLQEVESNWSVALPDVVDGEVLKGDRVRRKDANRGRLEPAPETPAPIRRLP